MEAEPHRNLGGLGIHFATARERSGPVFFSQGKSFLSTGLRRNNIKLIQVGETAASADGSSSSSTSCGNNTATGAGEAFLCESENRKATGAGGLKL